MESCDANCFNNTDRYTLKQTDASHFPSSGEDIKFRDDDTTETTDAMLHCSFGMGWVSALYFKIILTSEPSLKVKLASLCFILLSDLNKLITSSSLFFAQSHRESWVSETERSTGSLRVVRVFWSSQTDGKHEHRNVCTSKTCLI